MITFSQGKKRYHTRLPSEERNTIFILDHKIYTFPIADFPQNRSHFQTQMFSKTFVNTYL